MNFSITRLPTPSTTTPTADVQVNTPSQGSNQVQTLTISTTIGGGDGINRGNAIAIKLQFPTIGPEDISLSEVEQACKELGVTPHELNAILGAVLEANKAAKEIATMVKSFGPEYVSNNKEKVANLFGRLENTLDLACTSLYDLVASSKYPDFTDFLKLMLSTAQELKHLASEAKMAAVMGEYDILMDKAANMIVIADKNYAAGLKDIEASEREAIFKIVGGCLSFLGAIGGLSKVGQISVTAGAALGGIFESAGTLSAGGLKREALGLRKEAEYLEAGNTRLDATAKLAQNAQAIADELKEIAKTLQDMVLKLYQDFLSAQSQIVQRSNV